MRIEIAVREHVHVCFTLLTGAPPLVELPRALHNAQFDLSATSVFDIVESLRSQLPPPADDDDDDEASSAENDAPVAAMSSRRVFERVFASSEVLDRQSRFRAWATHVQSAEEAREFVAHLAASEKRVASSTHRMLAWKCANSCGRDDDGEGGAGDRLLFLFDKLKVDNVCVCVVRWMAGPQLGAVRFKHIGDVALEALKQVKESER